MSQKNASKINKNKNQAVLEQEGEKKDDRRREIYNANRAFVT
jgi:hypothetical protein